MAHPKEEALLSAATFGKTEKVQKLLAEGVPIEATNVNRMTSAMTAAQGGHIETFRVLVEAGANLHAVAFRQTDLLEYAVDGGNIEIVRFLLERGLPVNGHWQPQDNPALRKIGHDTPLIRAAEGGEVEIVRVLLAAGADRSVKHQGKTALELVKERLGDADYDELHPQYREIAALLGDVPAASRPSVSSVKDEIARFAANAGKPEYAPLHEHLVALCGAGRPWAPQPDHGCPAANVVAFTLKGCKRQKQLDELQRDALSAGCQLVFSKPWMSGETAELVLFPTADKFAVAAVVGTEGANHGVGNAALIAWLQLLDDEIPFQLHLCNHEAISGAFTKPVKSAKELANRIIEFCPSILDDDGVADAETLAAVLKKRKSFFLRWD